MTYLRMDQPLMPFYLPKSCARETNVLQSKIMKVRRQASLRTLLEAMARDIEEQRQSSVNVDSLKTLTGWSEKRLNRVARRAVLSIL